MLRPLLIALSFLTRLPLEPGEVRAQEFGRSVASFPVVGALLGLGTYALQAALVAPLGPQLTAAVIVAALALATGGLHLDGWSDVFDGLGAARGQRARALEIMHDSRIGAHGATALTLLLLTKVLVVVEALNRGQAWSLIAAPIGARCIAVPLISAFPYARETGLGRVFHEQTSRLNVLAAVVLTAACLAPLGARALPPLAGAAIVALLFAIWLHRKLGGLTGDVYGASIELSELVYLGCVVAATRAS
jgi:adenosylcobinamide-GDP ribazoletransferase